MICDNFHSRASHLRQVTYDAYARCGVCTHIAAHMRGSLFLMEMVVPITREERVLCLVLRRTIVTRKISRGLDPLGSHNLMKFTAGTSVRRG